jgi:hypothetical protein
MVTKNMNVSPAFCCTIWTSSVADRSSSEEAAVGRSTMPRAQQDNIIFGKFFKSKLPPVESGYLRACPLAKPIWW